MLLQYNGAACSAHSSGAIKNNAGVKIMAFSILNFSDLLRKDAKQEIVDFFKRKHLLASNRVCTNCNSAMEMEKRADISDGYRYN